MWGVAWPWLAQVAASRWDRRSVGGAGELGGQGRGGGGENAVAWDSGRRGYIRTPTPVSPSIPFKTLER